MDLKGDTHSAKEPYGNSRLQTIVKELAESDPIIIRALEDLMMVLLNKNVIGVSTRYIQWSWRRSFTAESSATR